MKGKLPIYILLIFSFGGPILSFVPCLGQCPSPVADTLAHETFETGIPVSWQAPDAQDGAQWQSGFGTIGSHTNPGQDAWVYINDASNDNVGTATLISATYDLRGFSVESNASFDLSFQEFSGEGYLLVEAWNGDSWQFLFQEEEDFYGNIKIGLNDFLIEDFQLRFTYSDEGAWAWGMGIDNFLVLGMPYVCNNSICDRSESPENCPSDCPHLPEPNAFWIPINQDLEGAPVNYRVFKGNTACDDCYDEIDLPFGFEFFDISYSKIFLNSNGNITLNEPYIEFTPQPFCLSGPKMIAPFYGDVDLNKGGSIHYYLDQREHYIILTWSDVRYYGCTGSACDTKNNFQCIITDGSVKDIHGIPIPNEVNVVFTYGEMSWTTGDASKGVDGFSGAAATVGLNLGDGKLCDDYGTFDHSGYDYYGNSQSDACPPNGINHLSFSSILLNASKGEVLPRGSVLLFEGRAGEGENIIRWTVSEANLFELFILESSTDGEDFSQVSIVSAQESAGQNIRNFARVDTSIHQGLTYYRLNMLKTNGTEVHSEVILVQNIWQNHAVKIIGIGPNPFSNYLRINFESVAAFETSYVLTDMSGRQIQQGRFHILQGQFVTTLSFPTLPKGMYTIRFSGAWGSSYKQLVKQ